MANGVLRGHHSASSPPLTDGCDSGPHLGEFLFRRGAGFSPCEGPIRRLPDLWFLVPGGPRTQVFSSWHPYGSRLSGVSPSGTQRGSSVLITQAMSQPTFFFIWSPDVSIRLPQSTACGAGVRALHSNFPRLFAYSTLSCASSTVGRTAPTARQAGEEQILIATPPTKGVGRIGSTNELMSRIPTSRRKSAQAPLNP